MKKIKENIKKEQYTYLMTTLKMDKSITLHRKQKLQIIYSLLYNCGMRVNETTQFTKSMLKKLIDEKFIFIETSKTNTERKLYITESGSKELKSIYDDLTMNDEDMIITNIRSKQSLSVNSVIRDTNSYLKYVLGDDTRITSHSFRQTLITDLSSSGVNTKVIKEFIGHSDIKTTMRYIKPSDETISECIEFVR